MLDVVSTQSDASPLATGMPQPREFDPARYYRSYPDVLDAGADALAHWTNHGQDEERRGLRPNWRFPRFASARYLEANPDVPALISSGDFDSAADHWFRAGRWEVAAGTRAPGIAFDEDSYLAARLDVAGAIERGVYLSGLDYWFCWGADEEANGSPEDAFQRYPWAATNVISQEKQDFWKKNGFMILEGAIPADVCDQAVNRLDEFWKTRHEADLPFCADVFLDRPDNRRIAFADVPDDARNHPFKINDTVLMQDVFREIALNPHVADVLRWALDGPPCVVTSLNFERGSMQDYHTDTLFMPGKRPGGMIATWFAFEDVTTDAGPLQYYPGSHDIPLYRFSTGLPNYVFEEWSSYVAHQMRHVDRLGLVATEFLPRKGDVLIWNERLFHGGAPIRDMSLTRKSLVCHYWDADLMPPEEIGDWNGAHYQVRPFMPPT